MTALVYSFAKAKKAKLAPKKPKQPKSQTPSEIFDDVYADIIDEWQLAARNNKLNNYVGGKVPPHARGPMHCDYVGDLNVVSAVEDKLGMIISVLSPSFSGNKFGWMAIFKYNNEVYSGPPDMAFESHARSFNILLFVEFQSRLKKLKKQ